MERLRKPLLSDWLYKRSVPKEHLKLRWMQLLTLTVEQMKPSLRFVILNTLAITVLMFLASGCDRQGSQKPVLKTEYQAGYSGNGQVFFGKIENTNAPFPLLIGETGYIRGQHGDKFYTNDDHVNHSAMNDEWNTTLAHLAFLESEDNLHNFYINGQDLGQPVSGYQNNFPGGPWILGETSPTLRGE
jgi:hypothetical protein